MKKGKTEGKEEETSVGTSGKIVSARGRIFKGNVIKRFGQRAVVEFERTVKIPKYERFTRKKTKLHARIPSDMDIKIGDVVKVRECRPLSKIVNFVVVEKIVGEKE